MGETNMTLRQLAKSNLFPKDVKIFINKTRGCYSYELRFEYKVNVGNVESSLIDEILDSEINFVQPKENAIIIYFIKDIN